MTEKIPLYEKLEFYIFLFVIVMLSIYFIPRIFKEKIIIYDICNFSFPEKPTIILRLDDIQDNTYGNVQQSIINYIIERNKSVSLAVIPTRLKGEDMTKYLNKIKTNSKIEIVQHGFTHQSYEYQNVTYDEALKSISEGKNLMQKTINVAPITFIPPNNAYNNNTIEVLKNLNFKIISAHAEIKFNGQLLFLGKNAQSVDYSLLDGYGLPITYSYTYVLDKCKTALDSINLCIIMIHPQDFVDSGKKNIDNIKYLQFTRLLEELDKIPDIQYKTFKDMLKCS